MLHGVAFFFKMAVWFSIYDSALLKIGNPCELGRPNLGLWSRSIRSPEAEPTTRRSDPVKAESGIFGRICPRTEPLAPVFLEGSEQ